MTGKSVLLKNSGMIEEAQPPQIRAAYHYWLSICNGNGYPSRQDLNPVDMKRLLPYVMLIDAPEKPTDIRIRLIGSAIIDFLGYDPTGRLMKEHLESNDSPELLKGYLDVMNTGYCHYLEDSLFSGSSESIRYHRLICPLSSDGLRIDCMFGAVCFDRLNSH